jgi:hypothetical protein
LSKTLTLAGRLGRSAVRFQAALSHRSLLLLLSRQGLDHGCSRNLISRQCGRNNTASVKVFPRSAASSTGWRQRSSTGHLAPCLPLTRRQRGRGGAPYFLPVSDGSCSPLASLVCSVCTGGTARVCRVSLVLTHSLTVFPSCSLPRSATHT